MTTIDPSDKAYELDPLVTRILKRGDLTRINCKSGKLKDHHGDLARVVKAEEVGPTLDNSHPYVYDLELVLGGKLHGVFRADLYYTTATKEGMLDDSRSQRKRKQNTLFDADPMTEAKKLPQAARKKKAAEKKAKLPTGPSKAAASKKRPLGEKAKGIITKKSKQVTPEEVAVNNAATTTQVTDLFERHKREFDRCLGRLEKADAYNFFGTEVPLEFQETYTKVESGPLKDLAPNSSHVVTALHSSDTSQTPSLEDSKSSKKSKMKENDENEAIRFPTTPPFNFVVIRQRMDLGRYVLDRTRIENAERIDLLTPYWKSIGRKNIVRKPKKSLIPVLHPKGINWELFREDIYGMCDSAVERNRELIDDDGTPGTLSHTSAKIKDLMNQLYEKNGRRHYMEMESANHRHRFSLAMDNTVNREAAMQGKWKKDAFPERKYERLRGDKVCAGLSELDERIAAYELKTSLDDKFIGLAYRYDDTGQSEGWMKSVLDVTGNKSEHQQAALALASDDGAIKAQVNASMQSLLIGVIDKVMTDSGVLQEKELRCANEMDATRPDGLEPEFVVHEVWGIDCYTRRNVATCLETEFDADTAQAFTEKWLLPAINACPVDRAHDISNACMILEGLAFDDSISLNNDAPTSYDQWKKSLLGKALVGKVATFGPPWLRAAARLVRLARDNLGPDFFRIHPKGHGSIVLCDRLEPNRLVTFYRGEVYPSWRWGEKTDAIAKIQEQKGLKPVLPDFFNMALERPQHDPRGYGLLFVDASRKSNHGSMLSHSCQPSCEVHVVAVNGGLRLAITTIREMTIGDELTFDYNAVTESLMEYQSAVCLCGHKRCSGSFLHFAAADCYQQVLNRNSPVASRLANLIKGCTKKVMADDDEKILKCHGFQTAAFGAVSVNRRKAHSLDKLDTSLDSMNIIPIWLRTYVADTLRYIEYERRALPIALVCNDLYDESGNVPSMQSEDSSDTESSAEAEGDEDETDEDAEDMEESKKLSKPEPTFFFYSRMQSSYFESLLVDDDKVSLSGTELRREVQKLAVATWNSLDEDTQETWKVKAREDWEQNVAQAKVVDAPRKEKKPVKKKKKVKTPKPQTKVEVTTKRSKRPISFQQADAEGVSAMEQRIQQLTQTLSRIGRVLDRHREAKLRLMNTSDSCLSDEGLREVVHSPLQIMRDEHVIAWMWNHEEGIVRSLVKYMDEEVCVSPELRASVHETVAKHDVLEKFGRPWDEKDTEIRLPLDPAGGRERLNEAILELRKNLLDGIQQMASAIKNFRAKSRVAARKQDLEAENLALSTEASDNLREDTVESVMEDILRKVEQRFSSFLSGNPSSSIIESTGPKKDADDLDDGLDPWLRHFNKRFKIEKAADLLLLYAKTSHFFSINAYEELRSSPIEVYARELGNAVPASTVDVELRKEPDSAMSSVMNTPSQSPSHDGYDESRSEDMAANAGISAKKSKEMCQPEDIISNVVVKYQGDYVLSQLLQWYNAGIGQKPGLPDILGCVLLPTMKGCWTLDGTTMSNSFTDRATRYQSATRRRLIAWLKDPLQRGNPWPDEVRRAFLSKDDDGMIHDATGRWLPLGSPILDFLVTGEDHNLNSAMAMLSRFHTSAERSANGLGDELLSTVDEGRPAEAVSNWVQCENPCCQKWRKVPWHIDIGVLPEQFYCKDVTWNPNSASCDAPEDVWDQTADAQVGPEDTRTIIDPSEKQKSTISNPFKLTDFQLGAKFDVRHEGKKSWSVGTVVKLDLSGATKSVKLHLQNRKAQEDEWIDVESSRLAPLYSKVKPPQKKEKPRQTKTMKKETFRPKAMVATSKTKRSFSEDTSLESSETKEESPDEHNDDISMTDIFTQDSDSETGDDKPISNEDMRVPVDPASSQPPEDLEFDDGVLEDSDDEREIEPKRASSMKRAATNVGDRDARESKKRDLKSVKQSSVWTIPKKKESPMKITVRPLEEATTSGEVNSTTRIPRKKPAESSKESDSLSRNGAQRHEGLSSAARQGDHVSTASANSHNVEKTKVSNDSGVPPRFPRMSNESIPTRTASPSTTDLGHSRDTTSDQTREAPLSRSSLGQHRGTWPGHSPAKQSSRENPRGKEEYPRDHSQSGYDNLRRNGDYPTMDTDIGSSWSKYNQDRRFSAEDADRRAYDGSEIRSPTMKNARQFDRNGHRAEDHHARGLNAEHRYENDTNHAAGSWHESPRKFESDAAPYGRQDFSSPTSTQNDRPQSRYAAGGRFGRAFDDFQYRSRGNEQQHDDTRPQLRQFHDEPEHEHDRSRSQLDDDRRRHEYDLDRRVHPYDHSRQMEAYDRSRETYEYDRSRYEHEYDRGRYEHEYDRNRYEHDYDRSRYERDYDRSRYEHEYDRSRYEHEYDRSRYEHEYDRSRREQEYDHSRQEQRHDRRRQEHEYERDKVAQGYDRSRQVHEYDRSRDDNENRRSRQEYGYDQSESYDERFQVRSSRHSNGSHRDRSRDRERSRKHRSESKRHRSVDRERGRPADNDLSEDEGEIVAPDGEENVQPNGEQR